MAHLKFDSSKIARLDDPARFETMNPRLMWEALGDPSPSVVVEIGAGTGLFSAAFAELAPASTVFATDIEPLMLEWMRAHRPEVESGRMVPIQSEEARVPLGDRSAQLVAMLNLHHELAEPHALYTEALRILERGGQILVVDWAPIDSPKGPPLAVRADADGVADMLVAVGFKATAVHAGVLPWHWLVTAVRP